MTTTTTNTPAATADEPRTKKSILSFFNRAGAPRIADLGFDAQPENEESEEDTMSVRNTAQDTIGVPGERIGHISFGFEGERWRIRNIVWVVAQSSTGLALVDKTYRTGYRIGFDSMLTTGERLTAFANPQDKVINLDPRATAEQLVAMLTLQLSISSAAIDGLEYDSGMMPHAALMANRMKMAYAHALQLQVAFELKDSTSLPSKTDRDIYWKLLSRDMSRLSSGFAQMAVNDFAIQQGGASAGAIREFYGHMSMRRRYDADVINYYRALPAAILKDPKSMTGGFDPSAAAYKLSFPGMVYAMTHDPRLNPQEPANAGSSQAVVEAVAALAQARKAAGVKDRDPWQIPVAAS